MIGIDQSVVTLAPPAIAPQPTAQDRLWYWRGWRIRYRYWQPPMVVARGQMPLVLVHGFGASLEQWRANGAVLAQDRPVYGVDLLGFGGSEKAAAPFSAALWAAQVGDFCRQVVGDRPVLLGGHSLGSLVALTVAIAEPQRCQALWLITLPAAPGDLFPPWVTALSQPMERLFANPLLIRPLFYGVRRPGILRAALRGIYRVPSRVDRELVEMFAAPPRDRGAARTLCHLVRARSQPTFTPLTKELLAQLSQPTLVLWGQADQVIPLSWGQQIPALTPQVTLQVVPGGHCCFDEYPEAVNGAIRQWCRTHG